MQNLMHEMEGERPWDAIDFDYPKDVPTMISREEQRYLYWLTSSYWRGSGHVVEMGPWLGGSTVCLAQGMVDSQRIDGRRLHVYDSFIWREFMAERHPLGIQVGESFQPAFERNVKAFADILTVNRAVLSDEKVENDSFAVALRDRNDTVSDAVEWTSNEPVEILFVDGVKSWSGFRQLLTTFGPCLTARESLLVLQDFKSWRAFWVAAITEFLSSSLSLTHNLRQNTVAFRVTKPLDSALLASIPPWSEISGERCVQLIEGAADRLESVGDAAGAAIVRLSGVRMWMHKGLVTNAIASFHESEREWPITANDANLSVLREWLAKETGEHLPVTVRSKMRRAILGVLSFPRRTVRRWRKKVSLGTA